MLQAWFVVNFLENVLSLRIQPSFLLFNSLVIVKICSG